ncbi:MAG: ABC transporter family substrate-binding protein [Gammaproteobacteria bacterium]
MISSAKFFALGATSALLIAGCGGNTSAPPTATAPPAATASSINAMPREKLRDGGTFTFAMNQMPTNFNYNEIDGINYDGARVMEALMPATFDNDAAGAPIWNRDYLANEPTLTTTNGQVVTYEINAKATWYDGTPITWEDFFWQWKANNGTDQAYRIGSANGYENIRSVERGKDDREVIVTYDRPYADWQPVFNPIYPSSTNRDPKIFNEGWGERPLTTAGPFKLDNVDRATQTITLVRNEKWWGKTPKLERMVFRAIDISAHVEALANGEVDAVDVGPDANKYRRALAIDGIEVRMAGGPNFRHLTINSTSATLSDVRVRRALAMAIDRTSIARALLGPLGVVPQPLNNHIYMANQEGYRDNSADVGTYDPPRAGQLLDEAGWTLAGDTRSKDGRVLEIHCVIPAGVQAARQESELIQNMLARVGVKMNIDTAPVNDFFEKYVTPGQFDFTIFSWMGTPYPLSSVKSIYANPTRTADGQLSVKQNFARVGSPELDDLMTRAGAEFDKAKAIELANQIDAQIWQEVHSLTLYQRPEIFAVKKGLANFGAFGLQQPWPYTDIGWVAER